MTINEQLDASIPRIAISTRNQSGKTLSYLEGWYVIDRLNQVLGTENWSHEIVNIIPLASEKPSYCFHVRIKATINGITTTKDGVGYGSDKSNFNAGEMAMKEAETDGLKRAAMKFGRSLGLALYDKSQEFVGEPLFTNPLVVESSVSNTPKLSATKATRGQIKSIFKILSAQKKTTAAEFSSKYLNGAKVDDLTDNDTDKVLNTIKTEYPEFA